MKIARTRRFGADVILYDRASEDREAIARSIGKERRAAFIHPFDDAGVIAGQGTAGLELAEDVAAAGIALDAVLVPCSGGGLATGIALAMQRLSPGTGIVIVEPAGFDDFARSLASGHCERNTKATGSIADALMAASPGELTLALARRLVTDAVTVTDAEIASAMRYAFEELKLVVEPGGAAALAALLHARIPCPGRTVAVLLSGANIDATTFASLIAGAAPIPAEHALM
jgi:threonine dehydratase